MKLLKMSKIRGGEGRKLSASLRKGGVAPQLGGLKSIKASYPHPCGKMIEVELTFEGGKARGRVVTPVAGEFVFGGVARPLVPGANEI